MVAIIHLYRTRLGVPQSSVYQPVDARLCAAGDTGRGPRRMTDPSPKIATGRLGKAHYLVSQRLFQAPRLLALPGAKTKTLLGFAESVESECP